VAENTQVRQLYRDALSGRLNRREVFQRGIALGLSANVIAMLALNAIKAPSAFAAEEGSPSGTFYSWMLNLHPTIQILGEELGVNVEEAPTENFGNDRFIAEGLEQKSTWDFYGGVTPFLEMIGLADSGTIEPWTGYLPAGFTDDFVPATLTEGTYKGEFYVWPLLLDISVQMRHAGIVEKAGLDPEASPATWDEFIANGQKVVDSGAAPYGIVFDHRDWRSLIPVTHSISIDVYDPETGLFQYASDAAVEALEILKRMMPLAPADLLTADAVDNTVHPDEAAFAAEQAGYYFKYQNAGFQFSANWPDPSQLRLGGLPKTEAGVGGSVFWDTGAVLFKYGANKQAAVDYLTALAKDERMWKDSVTGNEDLGTIPVGQLPVLQSV
jgi:multiple sugar transport system substrate-binding protein